MDQLNQESVPGRKSDPSMRDLLAPLFRRKRVLAFTFCAVLLGSVLAAFIVSNQHKASMEILINEERVDPSVTADSNAATPGSPPPVTDGEINSEMELLQSPDLLQGVVIANGLQDVERNSLVSRMLPRREDAWYIAKAAEHLGKKLTVENVSKSNLIQVTYKSSDPNLAYGVLQTLGKLYLAQHLAVHRPQGSYAFFTSQAEKYGQALAQSEDRLAAFAKQSGVAAPDVERTEMAQQVVTSVGALETAQQTIAADKHRIEDEQARMKATPDRSPTQEVSDSAQTLLQQLQADLLAAQLKKTQLLLKYDPSYPLVQEADEEIAKTQSAITSATKEQYVNRTTDRDPTHELMREDIARTQSELAFQQTNAKELESSIHSMQAQMVDLNQKALIQADLTREVKANEGNYLLYLSKKEQERTSDALDEKRIANVAIAVPPVVPILPWVSPALVLLCGVVLAAFVSAAAAFVAEYLNPSLRTPNEVLEVLRIPVLASVPKQTA